jgi:hypothetical protein
MSLVKSVLAKGPPCFSHNDFSVTPATRCVWFRRQWARVSRNGKGTSKKIEARASLGLD